MSGDLGERPPGPAEPDPSAPLPKEHDETPAPPASSSTSGDELNALLGGSLGEVQPDPYLGEFSTGERPSEGPAAAAAGTPTSESFDAVSALLAYTDPTRVEPAVIPATPEAAAPAGVTDGGPHEAASASPAAASSDVFPAIDLSAPPSSRVAPAREADRPEDDEDDDLPAPRGSWATLLLLSYASAVTLGLLWVLYSGRKVRERAEPEPVPAADTRPDPGVRADRSRKVTPPAPLPADHVTTLGKPLRMGALEATPLQVDVGPVALRRTVGEHETSDGGSGALRLRIRLKNVSGDTIFSPLDEAFLREREPGTLDSFIEAGQGGEVGMFPLAVASEWTIQGQEFRELRPGQSYETLVVSAPDAAGRLAPEMTWRLRLRTGINQTDTMGVRFRKDEVKASE